VHYIEDSSNIFRRLRRRGEAPENLSGFAAILKVAKEPVKNIGSNHILIKENFYHLKFYI